MLDDRDPRTMHDATTPERTGPAGAAGLARLDDLDDYEVADGFPDPRGWDVKSRDGRTVGTVKSLIVDREACAVRFLEVELADDVAGGQGDRCVHVPIGRARLDDEADDVILDLDAAGVADDPGRDDRSDSARFFGRRAAHVAGSAEIRRPAAR